MSSYWSMAQDFVSQLDEEEKIRFYNDLLMIEKVHQKNQDQQYYSLRKIRRASHRLFDDRMKSFHYININQDEIVIRQIQKQHFFKTRYKVEVLYNGVETDYLLVEELLAQFKQEFRHAASDELSFAAI